MFTNTAYDVISDTFDKINMMTEKVGFFILDDVEDIEDPNKKIPFTDPRNSQISSIPFGELRNSQISSIPFGDLRNSQISSIPFGDLRNSQISSIPFGELRNSQISSIPFGELDSPKINHPIKLKIPKSEMQLEMSINANLISFFHFGCLGTKGEYHESFNDIVRNLEKNKNVSFGIIAGDDLIRINDDIPNKEIMNSRIKELESLTIPIFSVMGNHDFDNNQIVLDEIDRTQFIMFNGKLCIDTDKSKWVMPKNYYNLYIHLHRFSVHFVFIDTNLFRTNFIQNKDLDDMLSWLEYVLNQNTASIIVIVGNNHLFAFMNSANNTDTLSSLESVDKLLKVLVNSQFSGKIYYLCSDIRNYQYLRFIGKGFYSGLSIDIINAGIGGGHVCPLPVSPLEYTIYLDSVGDVQLLDKDLPCGYLYHKISEGHFKSAYVVINEMNE
jgi:hypothetical protein